MVRAEDTPETLRKKVKLATILGTLQSSLSNFRYLNKKWKNNTEEERLLGVSLTGIMDNHFTNGSGGDNSVWNGKLLDELREYSVKVNKEYSKIIGVEPSAAITCVKPSGCMDKNTTIKTSNGIMSLEEIFDYMGYTIEDYNQGEWLESTEDLSVYDENNELQPITKLYVNGYAEIYELTDENGNIYNFTAEHKVKVVGSGWVRVDQLVEGQDIECYR